MSQPPAEIRARREHSRVVHDLIIITLIAAVVFVLACVFNGFEAMARRWEVDEVVAGVTISAVAFGVFSLRRWHELVGEVAQRKRSEGALRRAQEELEERVALRTAELARANAHLQKENAERRQAEEKLLTYQEQLRYLAAQLSLAEERTRRRIATGLHDRIGQALAICRIRLGELGEGVPPGHLAELVGEVREQFEQVIRDARSLTFELSPPVLYELGIEAAIEALADQIASRHGIRARVSDDGCPKPLANDLRVLLFQAARELMLNVVKHAHASNMDISLCRSGDTIVIQVKDDGRGFSAAAVRSRPIGPGGFCLFSIRERLNHIGGSLDVESAPGAGTRVTLAAPMTPDHQTPLVTT